MQVPEHGTKLVVATLQLLQQIERRSLDLLRCVRPTRRALDLVGRIHAVRVSQGRRGDPRSVDRTEAVSIGTEPNPIPRHPSPQSESQPPRNRQGPHMTAAADTDLRTRREAVVREHMASEDRHEFDVTMATFGHSRYE